ETEVWADFATALDPATVNARTVGVRLDSQRIPCDVAWLADSNRIRIRPHVGLQPLRTYTAAVGTPGATAPAGRPAAPFTWPFRTSGIRRTGGPDPPDGTEDESRFVTLSWDSTGRSAGTITYDLVYGSDSAGVAIGTGRRLLLDRPYHLPVSSWPAGE